MSKTEPLIDEGLRVSMVERAFFDGELEIPHIDAPDAMVIPKGLIPFSEREKSKDFMDFVCFYEHDVKFRKVLTHTEEYVSDLKRFQGVITPDCSLYIDAPLCVQLISIYLNRAIGYYLRQQGLYVIPNVRWGGMSELIQIRFLRRKWPFWGLINTVLFPLVLTDK